MNIKHEIKGRHLHVFRDEQDSILFMCDIRQFTLYDGYGCWFGNALYSANLEIAEMIKVAAIKHHETMYKTI